MELGRWTCIVLEWTPEEISLLQDRPFSAAQEKHGRLRTTRHFPAPEDRRLCMRIVLVSTADVH